MSNNKSAAWRPWADAGLHYSEGKAAIDVRVDGLSAHQAAVLHDQIRELAFAHLLDACPDVAEEPVEQPLAQRSEIEDALRAAFGDNVKFFRL